MIRLNLPHPVAGSLWASPMPFSPFDPDKTLWERYRQANIRAVVVLASVAECVHRAGRNLVAWYQQQGLRVLHYPIPDFGVPDPVTLPQALDQTWSWVTGGMAVAVHCQAGRGRTGLFLAALACRHLLMDAAEALAWVRVHIPGAVETSAQRAFLFVHASAWRKTSPTRRAP